MEYMDEQKIDSLTRSDMARAISFRNRFSRFNDALAVWMTSQMKQYRSDLSAAAKTVSI